jgi:aryl-alcohol dehydrogenase-like predicted oxidoreductase
LPPFDSISINNSINKSLERLNKDTIDLVFFHRWDKDLKDPGAFASLADLIKEKKVRMLGVSNFNTQQLTEIIDLLKEHDLPEIKFIQNNNNFAVSDISDDLYRICLENKILIMTYSPLAAGFLTGKHQDGIGKGTRFEIIPGHKDVYFKEAAFRRLDKLNSVASNTGYSPVHLALAWALHQRSVTTVLIGGRTTAHIDQALAAMDFNYPEIFKDLDSE